MSLLNTPGPRLRFLPTAVIGVYVWATTVAPLASGAQAPPIASAGAAFALLCLVGAWLLAGGRWAPPLGIYGFVASSLLCWWGGQDVRASTEFAFFGVLGWLAYALAWGSLSQQTVDESKDPGPKLHPRVAPRRWIFWTFIAFIVLIPALLAVPARLEGPSLYILGEAAVLAVVLLLLQAAARTSAVFQSPHGVQHRPFAGTLAASLVIVVFVAVGVLWWLG